jgi:hypothetical protein
MKHFLLAGLVLLVVVGSAFGFKFYQQSQIPTAPVLVRIPNSAYKYQLCTQAYAFAFAGQSNPYKADYSFKDPFSNIQDTITPHLLEYNPQTHSVHFKVDVVIGQRKAYHLDIQPVYALDGIAVLLPDQQNRLQESTEPQFILSSLDQGKLAVLDYTCPEYWVWHL